MMTRVTGSTWCQGRSVHTFAHFSVARKVRLVEMGFAEVQSERGRHLM